MGDVPALSIEIVNLDASMAEELERIEHLAFPMANKDELFSVEIIEAYARVFPEGYFVAMVDGSPVGPSDHEALTVAVQTFPDQPPAPRAEATATRFLTDPKTWPALGQQQLLADLGVQVTHACTSASRSNTAIDAARR